MADATEGPAGPFREPGLAPRRSPPIVLALRDSHAAQPRGTPRPVSIGGIRAFKRLGDAARSRGFRFLRYDQSEDAADDAVLLWDIASFPVLPRDLARFGRERTIAWSLESPLIAHRAYHRLDRVAQQASHAFLFPGAAAFLPNHCKFHPLYWPNEPSEEAPFSDAERPGFLTMIATNKRSYRGWEGLSVKKPYLSLRMVASRLLQMSYPLRRRWRVPDLYHYRLEAVRHFAQHRDFHLYGVGWDKRVPHERLNRPAIAVSHRGAVDDKLDTLRRYSFALCFENTVFPGYITEKIFDCMLAGCVPVYLGAPDVDAYIPRSCFIDMRDFRNLRALETHLKRVSPGEEQDLRSSISSFLTSGAFTRFTAASFTERILRVADEARGGR